MDVDIHPAKPAGRIGMETITHREICCPRFPVGQWAGVFRLIQLVFDLGHTWDGLT